MSNHDQPLSENPTLNPSEGIPAHLEGLSAHLNTLAVLGERVQTVSEFSASRVQRVRDGGEALDLGHLQHSAGKLSELSLLITSEHCALEGELTALGEALHAARQPEPAPEQPEPAPEQNSAC